MFLPNRIMKLGKMEEISYIEFSKKFVNNKLNDLLVLPRLIFHKTIEKGWKKADKSINHEINTNHPLDLNQFVIMKFETGSIDLYSSFLNYE